MDKSHKLRSGVSNTPPATNYMTYNLDKLLLGLLGSTDLVNIWWDSPNINFGLDTPNQWFNSSSQVKHTTVVDYIVGMSQK
jgi:hypothetical protein